MCIGNVLQWSSLLSSPQLVVCNRHDFILYDLQCRDTFLWHVIKTQRWDFWLPHFNEKVLHILIQINSCVSKKNSPTSFSLQLKHLVTTLLKPKNEDFTFSSCLKHIFFITLLYLVYWCTTYVIWVYVVLSFLWENFFSLQCKYLGFLYAGLLWFHTEWFCNFFFLQKPNCPCLVLAVINWKNIAHLIDW